MEGLYLDLYIHDFYIKCFYLKCRLQLCLTICGTHDTFERLNKLYSSSIWRIFVRLLYINYLSGYIGFLLVDSSKLHFMTSSIYINMFCILMLYPSWHELWPGSGTLTVIQHIRIIS